MRRVWSRMLPLVGALLIALSAAAPAALAQEATPAAGVCDAPELPPGTPTPMEEIGNDVVASPDTDMATPEMVDNTPALAPATPELPTGTPADADTTAMVTAAVVNVVACFNEGNFLGVAALFTPAALLEDFGTENPYDLEAFFSEGDELTLVSITNVQVLDGGRYSADIVTSFNSTQLTAERWVLVAADRFLLVDSTPQLDVPPPEGAVTIEVAMLDYDFRVSQTTAPANTPLVFRVTNPGEYPHELLLVQMAQSASPEMLLTGELTFNDILVLGATYSEGGQPAPDLILLGLNPGRYYMICMVHIPDDVPHLARGMFAELTVED